MSDTDTGRPPRERVEAALATVRDWSGLRRYPDVILTTEMAIDLAAEVHALRAALDRVAVPGGEDATAREVALSRLMRGMARRVGALRRAYNGSAIDPWENLVTAAAALARPTGDRS